MFKNIRFSMREAADRFLDLLTVDVNWTYDLLDWILSSSVDGALKSEVVYYHGAR